jgi:hypothetical protein
MRRQAAPADGARQAQSIEHRRVVLGDAAPEQPRLPAIRGRLEALQLLEDGERAALAERLRARREMLPREEPPHERGRGDRLDLAAQPAQRELVNSRKQTPLAPLERSGRQSELAAEDDARRLETQERFVDGRDVETDARAPRSGAVTGPECSIHPWTNAPTAAW